MLRMQPARWTMVNFGRLEEMAKTSESLSTQMHTLGASIDERFGQVDERFAQVDKRFEQVDKRFDKLEKRMEEGFAAVDEHFAEQRAYTEFAFGRLEQTMNGRFDRVE